MAVFPVDFSSDTQTRPSAAMRQAIANAEVGDEQKREDPSVNKLQEMVAELCGKEAALFLPTGTMCNLIAHFIHCRAGDEIILEASYHPVNFEGGGPAIHSRASLRLIDSPTGIFGPDDIVPMIRPNDAHMPRTRMVCVENTCNLRGGRVWSVAQVKAVTECAREYHLITHLDGARLMNAVVAAGVTARDYCEHFDSCWIDLSKGLGCPVGGVLAGTRSFIDEAWRAKHFFGGAMRQAGMLAAAGIFAFENNVERLADDHDKAKRLAVGLAELPGVSVDVDAVESNIVVFDIGGTGKTPKQILAALQPHGVRFSPLLEPTVLRAVSHLDIPDDGVDKALIALKKVLDS